MSLLAVLAPAVAAVVVRPPTKPPTPPAPVPDAHPAADVAGAPVPGAESGRTDPMAPPDGAVRAVARAVLFVPKLVFEIAFSPVRGGLWLYDRYQLRERYLQIFFTEDRRIGLLPMVKFESGYGVTAGAKLVDRDMFGAGEHLTLRAGSGGRFRYLLSGELHTGRRFGDRVELGFAGERERRPHDAFYGLGDVDDAREARFRQSITRGIVTADFGIAAPLYLRASGALASFTFERSTDGPPIDALYPASATVGFDGFRQGYGELELRWDTRRSSTPWEVTALASTGWLVLGFGGRAVVFDEDMTEPGALEAMTGRPHDYWRYGVDLQRFFRLAAGPRVVSARVYAEAVSADADEVPFNQLPRLGGATLLRGYPTDRFRDRVAALGSVEYSWDLMRELSASLFVDVGRVAPGLSTLADGVVDGDLRLGYGIAFDAHSRSTFAVRGSIASSIDGGVFVNLALDPLFELRERVERR